MSDAPMSALDVGVSVWSVAAVVIVAALIGSLARHLRNTGKSRH